MKPTRKRKLKAYWNIEEKIRRIQCARKIRRRRGGGDNYFFTLDDLLASESRAFQQEVARNARRLLDNLRRRRKGDSYPQENHLIEVPEGAFPPEGAVYGKWLLLDELRNSNEPRARTFSFIRGGPAHMHERIWTEHGNESRIAAWFNAPQQEFANRIPWQMISEDGIPGAWAVAAALDAMAPDGPPVLIKQGRSASPRLDFELSKTVLHAKPSEPS